MSITESLTRVADAQALWTHQLRGKTTVDAITSLFATESQSLETVIQDILTARSIDGAVGVQLDDLGALVGQFREGRPDDRFRIWIKARIIANRSSGSPPDMYAIASTILGTSVALELIQIPTGHALEAGANSPVPIDDLWRILQGASSAGVPFWYHYLLHNTDTFTLGSTTGWTPTPAQGLGAGRLRGSWGATTRASDPPGLTVLKSSLERWRLDKFITEGQTITSLGGEYYSEPLAQTGSNTAPTGHLNTLKDSHTELRFPTSAVDPLVTTSTRFVRALRGAWSIAWVGKPQGASTPPGYLMHATGATTSYRIHAGNDGVLTYYLDSGVSVKSGTFDNVPHVGGRESAYVLTYDGAGTLTAYVNGVEQVESIGHAAEMDSMEFDEFRFGAFQDNYTKSWGSLYDLAIFDFSLTQAQALDLGAYLQAEYLEAGSRLSETAIGYWSAEDVSGTTAWGSEIGPDLAGLLVQQADAYRQGLLQAAEFSTASHYMTGELPAGDATVFEGDKPFTVFWYGAQDVASGVMTVIDFNDDGTGTDYTQVRSNLANIQIEFVDGGGSSVMSAAAAPGDTNPHTWTVVYDGSGAGTAYVDGVPTAFGTVAAPTQSNITHVTVGNLNATKSPYWGTLGCIGVLPYAAGFDKVWQLHTDMRRRFER